MYGVITWTDLKINYWATAVRIRFTATTLSGTTMTASYRDSSNFIVGGMLVHLRRTHVSTPEGIQEIQRYDAYKLKLSLRPPTEAPPPPTFDPSDILTLTVPCGSTIGISFTDEDRTAAGFIVKDVTKGSAAYSAGVRQGDRILTLSDDRGLLAVSHTSVPPMTTGYVHEFITTRTTVLTLKFQPSPSTSSSPTSTPTSGKLLIFFLYFFLLHYSIS